MKFYYNPTSWFALPCLVGLEEVGKPFEKQVVDYSDGSNLSKEYREINPNCTVPSLVDQDLVLTDSREILKHVCQLKPELNPEQHSKEIDEFIDSFYSIQTTPLVYGSLGQGSNKTKILKMLENRKQKALDMAQRDEENSDTWNKKAQENQDRIDSLNQGKLAVDSVMEQCRFLVSKCNKQLGKGGPFLFGSEFTIADACMATALTRFQQFGVKLWGDGMNFRIPAYLNAVSQRSSTKLLFPVASKQTKSSVNPLIVAGIAISLAAVYVAYKRSEN